MLRTPRWALLSYHEPMPWVKRKKPTGVKPVKAVKAVKPAKAVKPVKAVRPVKPVAPVGYEYVWKD